jgi:ADP-ribose diphosphatase
VGYTDYKAHIVIAEDLYREKLSGDEPEPIQTHYLSVSKIGELIRSNYFFEAVSVLALLLANKYLEEHR